MATAYDIGFAHGMAKAASQGPIYHADTGNWLTRGVVPKTSLKSILTGANHVADMSTLGRTRSSAEHMANAVSTIGNAAASAGRALRDRTKDKKKKEQSDQQ